MLERLETVLKIACLALAALLLVQVSRVAFVKSPLANLSIPELPTLAAATNAAPQAGKSTDNLTAKSAEQKGTNASPKEAKAAGTNSSSAAQAPKTSTNSATANSSGKTNSIAASRVELESAGSNAAAAKAPESGKSNSISLSQTNKSGTNLVAGAPPAKSVTTMMNMRPPGGPGGGPGAAPLAPAIKARVSRITESELLAPVFHPMPAGLLGIAGNVAFLRSDDGQTGLVKEGDNLSNMKLLRIGVNRVLVEQDGEKKELMIFDGYGGESLMPTKQEKSP
jgi:hypothetical protein